MINISIFLDENKVGEQREQNDQNNGNYGGQLTTTIKKNLPLHCNQKNLKKTMMEHFKRIFFVLIN